MQAPNYWKYFSGENVDIEGLVSDVRGSYKKIPPEIEDDTGKYSTDIVPLNYVAEAK